MRRYLIDGETPASAAVLSGLVSRTKRSHRILSKADPFVYPSTNTIIVSQGLILSLFNGLWRSFEVDTEIRLTSADIDEGGSWIHGTDYYVYLVDDGGDGHFVISRNSTFPLNQNADNSRKIGGFHVGTIRHTNAYRTPIDTAGVNYGLGGGNNVPWMLNIEHTAIIDNSVWDFENRPSCPPEGMVKVTYDLWVDIYLVSGYTRSENYTQGGDTLDSPGDFYKMSFTSDSFVYSRYGQMPIQRIWLMMNEMAMRMGKRLPSPGEWLAFASGSPGGTDITNTQYGMNQIAWADVGNNDAPIFTGCAINPATGAFDPSNNGKKHYAISAYNITDCVGNLAEHTDSFSPGANGSDIWGLGGSNKGISTNFLCNFWFGGNYYDGEAAGARRTAQGANNTNANAINRPIPPQGARFVCGGTNSWI